MRWLVACLVLILSAASVAADVPARAKEHLPALIEAQQAIWPDAPTPYFLAGQIEQETCISLKHSKCWNPRAELNTSRENGVGLGQFTRAYRKDGSIRFDKISELAAAHASLRGWSWETRYDPGYQLKAIVEMDRGIYMRQRGAASAADRLAFSLSAYNGGESGLLMDRRLCANTPGCDSTRWRGHVERTCTKSKVPHPGYRLSFCEINREYPHNILFLRAPKYAPFFDLNPRRD